MHGLYTEWKEHKTDIDLLDYLLQLMSTILVYDKKMKVEIDMYYGAMRYLPLRENFLEPANICYRIYIQFSYSVPS